MTGVTFPHAWKLEIVRQFYLNFSPGLYSNPSEYTILCHNPVRTKELKQ